MPPSGTPCKCCNRLSKLFCDHDHTTKQFRGWICKNCNAGMGLLGDSSQGCRQAAAYLDGVSNEARPKDRSRSPTVNKDGGPEPFGYVDMALGRTDDFE